MTTLHRAMTDILNREWKAVLAVIAIGLLAIVPALIFGSPSNQDLTHHFRLALHFFDGMQAGHAPDGWLTSAASGYGDVTPRFYPPALYYLLAGARLLFGNWHNAALFTYALLSILGALGAYVWAREFLPMRWAVCAAAIYTFAPYHLNQFYQSFLLAEYAGAAVLPFCFAFVLRICRRGQWRDVCGLAISYALLVLTHLPLTVIGSIALGLYALFCLERKRFGPMVGRLAVGVLLGLGASASYWVTMLAELSWFGGQQTSSDSSTRYDYNFVFSTFSPDNLNVWWMNILVLATLAMFLPALAYGRYRFGEEPRRNLRAILISFLFSLAMCTYLTWPLWRFSKTLQSVQFPWRWMAIVTLAGAPLAAAHLPFWIAKARTKARPLALLIGGGMAISLAFVLAHSVREAEYLRRPAFEARVSAIPATSSYDMWWPRWGKPEALAIKDQIQASGRTATVSTWQPLIREFSVAAGAPTDARVALFYYPHWVATTENGAALPVHPAADGALTVAIPANATNVKLIFREPKRALVARYVSLGTWILVLLLFFASIFRRFNEGIQRARGSEAA